MMKMQFFSWGWLVVCVILNIFAGGVFSALALFLMLIHSLMLGGLLQYIGYIFDFDPPDKKKRKEKREVLTDMAKRQWQRAIDAVKPLPNPAPA